MHTESSMTETMYRVTWTSEEGQGAIDGGVFADRAPRTASHSALEAAEALAARRGYEVVR